MDNVVQVNIGARSVSWVKVVECSGTIAVVHSAVERTVYRTSYNHCDSESVEDGHGLLCHVGGCSGVGG